MTLPVAVALHLGRLALPDALDVMDTAETVMAGGEYAVPSPSVLRLAARSKCSACDCEFVALAQDLGTPLVTADRGILKAFARTAVALEEYGAG